MFATASLASFKPFDISNAIAQSALLTKTFTTDKICSLPVQSHLPSTYNSGVLHAIMKKNTCLSEGLFLQQSLPINIKQEPNGGFFVEDDVFSMYGIGDTIAEALNDYIVSLTEYFLIVEESLLKDNRNLKKFGKLTEYINR